MYLKAELNPVEIGYLLSDLNKKFQKFIPRPVFTDKDPSEYNLIAFFCNAMKGICYNREEIFGSIFPKSDYICDHMRCANTNSNILIIELDKQFTIDDFCSNKNIKDRLDTCMNNIDIIGNILPGIWDDRYSFDVSNRSDRHWVYAISFMVYVIHTIIKNFQYYKGIDDSMKEISAYSNDHKYFIKVRCLNFENQTYNCIINMPNHVFDFDKKFFDTVYSKGCEIRENGKETKDQQTSV